MSSNPPPAKRRRQQSTNQPLIQPIDSGTILSDASIDGDLIGEPPAERVVNPVLYDSLMTISAFLRQHQFLSSGHETGANAGLSRIYGPVIKEFSEAQMERQAAGLRTNTSAATAATLKKVVDCHADALQHGLDTIATQESWLTGRNMQSTHSKLCPDIRQSGRYRDNRVRAGNTSFTSSDKISQEIEKFELAVKRFETKWASSSASVMDEKQWRQQVYQKVAIAAIVLFGINDIHPFQVSYCAQFACSAICTVLI